MGRNDAGLPRLAITSGKQKSQRHRLTSLVKSMALALKALACFRYLDVELIPAPVALQVNVFHLRLIMKANASDLAAADRAHNSAPFIRGYCTTKITGYQYVCLLLF